MFLPLERQAHLRTGTSKLVINFANSTEDRTIVVDPALQDGLAQIVVERAGWTIPWEEVRAVLKARGADLSAADARGRAVHSRASAPCDPPAHVCRA
jgi:hypothetical protein